jgi:dCTP deaminase
MELLCKSQIEERLKLSDDRALAIDPLLDEAQIGEVTVDFRLGYDFLVSVLTRKAYIGNVRSEESFRGSGIPSFFKRMRMSDLKKDVE